MAKKQANLLAIVLDMNPVWWGQISRKYPDASFTHCVDSIISACNAFMMMDPQNKLCFIVSCGSLNHFVYPKMSPENSGQNCSLEFHDSYMALDKLGETVRNEIQELIGNSGEILPDSVLTGAISKGLCFINRMKNEETEVKLSPRILVIKGSKDNPFQYMDFTSIIYAAQKMGVTMDSCILDNDSSFLKQACDILGGLYVKLPQIYGFLEYILYLYMPDAGARSTLAFPSFQPLGHKAACFCHRTLVDVGFVCSVCLSIFCSFNPICPTCQSAHKVHKPQRPTKKKQSK